MSRLAVASLILYIVGYVTKNMSLFTCLSKDYQLLFLLLLCLCILFNGAAKYLFFDQKIFGITVS